LPLGTTIDTVLLGPGRHTVRTPVGVIKR
jgi:hypothetical protein